jgi:hypothetical protein
LGTRRGGGGGKSEQEAQCCAHGARNLRIARITCLAAHDLFIKPPSYFLAPNSASHAYVVNGTFTRSENSITLDRVRDVSVVGPAVVTGGRTMTGARLTPGAHRTDAEGVVRVLLRSAGSGT